MISISKENIKVKCYNIKNIEEFTEYKVDTNGIIYNCKNKIIKHQKHTGGYLTINFWNKKTKKHKTRYVHRIVAIAFVDNPNNLNQINHINGIKEDNKAINLEWCTPKQNINHAIVNGLIKTGDKSTSTKISDECVELMKDCYKTNIFTYVQLANVFGICKQQVERIINNKRRIKKIFREELCRNLFVKMATL